MSAILNFPKRPSYSYASFGPTTTNCYQDLGSCINAAMNVQIPWHDGADMYVFEGTTKTIICVITFNGVDFTKNGRKFLKLYGIDAA